MKNIKFITSVLPVITILFCCSSCNKDLIESTPTSFTSPENFYRTAAEAELAINGCYSVLNDASIDGNGSFDTFARAIHFMLNSGTDEMVTRDGFSRPPLTDWGLAAFNSENSNLRFNWFFWYSGINRVNLLLERIDGITDLDADRKNEIIGEARFLRALYHMYLAQMFGGIPTYTVSDADPLKARQPLSEVYPLIIEDFTFAYENLNDRASITGRANKWAAGGFLARVYCYLASSRKSGASQDLNFELNSFDFVDDATFYGQALTIASDVVTNSGYILIDEYDFLFRETTKARQREECLFLAEGTSNGGEPRVGFWNTSLIPSGNRDRVGGGPGWIRPTGELYMKYVDGDIRRDHNFTNGIANNADTEEIDGFRYFIPRQLNNINQGNYSQGKFRYIDPSQKNIPNGSSSGNFPLLRLADVMLLKAEAQFETGNEPGARETVSELRLRAAGNDEIIRDELDNAYFKADFLQELLDERSRELCFEAQRRFDLARFNQFTQAINSLSSGDNAGRWNVVVPQLQTNWNPSKIWFPIPFDQLLINPNLVQNP